MLYVRCACELSVVKAFFALYHLRFNEIEATQPLSAMCVVKDVMNIITTMNKSLKKEAFSEMRCC